MSAGAVGNLEAKRSVVVVATHGLERLERRRVFRARFLLISGTAEGPRLQAEIVYQPGNSGFSAPSA